MPEGETTHREEGWWYLVVGICLPAIGIGLGLSTRHAPVLPHIFYGATKVFLLVWPMLVIGRFQRQRCTFRLHNRVALGRSVGEGALVGIGWALALFMVLKSPLGAIVEGAAPRIAEVTQDLGLDQHYLTFALLISLGHSLVEEYYWRGFVYGQFRNRLNRASAHGLTALAFSLHHVVICVVFVPSVWGVVFGIAVSLGGLSWSLLYERHGTFWGAWISHLIVDLALMRIGADLLQFTAE